MDESGLIEQPDPVFLDFLVIIGDHLLSDPKTRGDLTPRKYKEVIQSMRDWTLEGMMYYKAFIDTPSLRQSFEWYKANRD